MTLMQRGNEMELFLGKVIINLIWLRNLYTSILVVSNLRSRSYRLSKNFCFHFQRSSDDGRIISEPTVDVAQVPWALQKCEWHHETEPLSASTRAPRVAPSHWEICMQPLRDEFLMIKWNKHDTVPSKIRLDNVIASSLWLAIDCAILDFISCLCVS